MRIEKDTMGEVEVPVDALWGAQTGRSLMNFHIGKEIMPKGIIHSFAILKRSIAIVNNKLGKLEDEKTRAIVLACDEVLENLHAKEFPLSVWQTGSGTQTNMNVNEVVANLATKILGGDFKKKKLIHPNDDVNMSQSSNDTFPTAMHVAAILAVEDKLLPKLISLKQTLEQKAQEYKDVVKIGRTHLQDATPLSVGQEISGWAEMLQKSEEMIKMSLLHVRELALGGTAVGTGLNAHPKLGVMVAEEISRFTCKEFITAPNKFHALTSHDALVFSHGALKALAADLMKIANDVRWLSSGPRCGIGEYKIPANEPGSSIMPGKVNPTQAEAVTMVTCQVFGNDTTIAMAASQGNFELNVFKPVLINAYLQSVKLLGDVMRSFNENCIVGLEPIQEKIDFNLHNSLMLVTALNPHIGYENAANIAKNAHEKGISLKESAMEFNLLSEEEFDEIINPQDMI
ncbi:class II fumarate hydratase [Sulfurospirillum arcachonense]|uniref:class II fumarate hydratase n=1 Tax=Sulfurospirillum arcachonense TaxID=57666 RepID=UPI00046818E7|nr:class II fumarate hydratase [Sulfurospirillum arcachonense]